MNRTEKCTLFGDPTILRQVRINAMLCRIHREIKNGCDEHKTERKNHLSVVG